MCPDSLVLCPPSPAQHPSLRVRPVSTDRTAFLNTLDRPSSAFLIFSSTKVVNKETHRSPIRSLHPPAFQRASTNIPSSNTRTIPRNRPRSSTTINTLVPIRSSYHPPHHLRLSTNNPPSTYSRIMFLTNPRNLKRTAPASQEDSDSSCPHKALKQEPEPWQYTSIPNADNQILSPSQHRRRHGLQRTFLKREDAVDLEEYWRGCS
jgi:hypothetical protein